MRHQRLTAADVKHALSGDIDDRLLSRGRGLDVRLARGCSAGTSDVQQFKLLQTRFGSAPTLPFRRDPLFGACKPGLQRYHLPRMSAT